MTGSTSNGVAITSKGESTSNTGLSHPGHLSQRPADDPLEHDARGRRVSLDGQHELSCRLT